jgi:hypothetical protein
MTQLQVLGFAQDAMFNNSCYQFVIIIILKNFKVWRSFMIKVPSALICLWSIYINFRSIIHTCILPGEITRSSALRWTWSIQLFQMKIDEICNNLFLWETFTICWNNSSCNTTQVRIFACLKISDKFEYSTCVVTHWLSNTLI